MCARARTYTSLRQLVAAHLLSSIGTSCGRSMGAKSNANEKRLYMYLRVYDAATATATASATAASSIDINVAIRFSLQTTKRHIQFCVSHLPIENGLCKSARPNTVRNAPIIIFFFIIFQFLFSQSDFLHLPRFSH